jgi:hypothetical protein
MLAGNLSIVAIFIILSGKQKCREELALKNIEYLDLSDDDINGVW